MSGPLFSLRNVTLPASDGRQSPDCDLPRVANHPKHNQGIDIPRSPGMRLNGITLEIPARTTAIVGLSGAGKTTLLNVLAGFETGYSGEITLERTNHGTDIPRSPKRLPLFWVPQTGGLWPHLSAEQHLEVVASPQSADESAPDSARFSRRTDELLSLFDLQQRRHAFPVELSQGERSRLALARALGSRASVLLLDEPLSHVDPVRKPGYWQIVRQIVAVETINMVFTSHEPETVLRQAEHVICLEAGTVAFAGSTKTLYDNPPNPQVGEFLGPLNWFSVAESMAFLNGKPESGDVGIRPERMRICVSSDSGLELVSMPFVGSYCESVIRDFASGMTKSVMHQVPDEMRSVGDHVLLRR